MATFTGRRARGGILNCSNSEYLSISRFLEQELCKESYVNIGMQSGWDLVAGLICKKNGIRVQAFVPHKDMRSMIHKLWVYRYDSVLEYASSVTVMNEDKFTPKDFTNRNDAMLADCSDVIAVWEGGRSGGTFYTLNRAKTARYIWDDGVHVY